MTMHNEPAYAGIGPTPTSDHSGQAPRTSLDTLTEKLPAQIRETAQNAVHGLENYANEKWTDATKQARNLADEAGKITKDNPVQTLLVALGAGFILGVMFRR